MAQQELTMFADAADPRLGFADGHNYKFAIVTDATTPTANTPKPQFTSGTGATDFSANEVSPGGNYEAGGIDIAGAFTQNATSKVFMLDGTTNPYFAAAAGGPAGCAWGIIYDDSLPGKPCIAFVQLQSDDPTPVPLNNTTHNIGYTFAGSGIATFGVDNS